MGRKTKSRVKRRRTRKQRQTGGVLCPLEGDIFKLGKQIGHSRQLENVSYASFSAQGVATAVINKMTTTGANTLKKLSAAYVDMYKTIKLAYHGATQGTGPKVLFAKITSDETLNPVGYLVLEHVGLAEADAVEEEAPAAHAFPGEAPIPGLLAAPPQGTLAQNLRNSWIPGAQIGQADQIGESEDPLFIASDPAFIIKTLTGAGVPHSLTDVPSDIGKTFADIYMEIKMTMRAATIGVGPAVPFAKICSGPTFKPIGHIVMERIKGRYVNKDQIKANRGPIADLITTLYENRITHGDLHNRNIMYGTTRSNPEPRMWIIDYGTATQTRPAEDREYTISIISDEHPNAAYQIEHVHPQ
jgi:hypothetical protein